METNDTNEKSLTPFKDSDNEQRGLFHRFLVPREERLEIDTAYRTRDIESREFLAKKTIESEADLTKRKTRASFEISDYERKLRQRYEVEGLRDRATSEFQKILDHQEFSALSEEKITDPEDKEAFRKALRAIYERNGKRA